MKKINVREIAETAFTSPKGKYSRSNKDLSIALGRKPDGTQLSDRHPFDVQICRIPSGKTRCPYHLHTAQWEFYHVISGAGWVRHSEGLTPIEKDDAFLFGPEEPHQLTADGDGDLVLYIVADNPVGESCYYPDSKKWLIDTAKRHILRSDLLDYFDGEE